MTWRGIPNGGTAVKYKVNRYKIWDARGPTPNYPNRVNPLETMFWRACLGAI